MIYHTVIPFVFQIFFTIKNPMISNDKEATIRISPKVITNAILDPPHSIMPIIKKIVIADKIVQPKITANVCMIFKRITTILSILSLLSIISLNVNTEISSFRHRGDKDNV